MAGFVHTKVDPERLTMTAVYIEDSLKLAENALHVVDDSLNNTLRPTWSGPASSQFFSQYSSDAQSFKSLVKSLRDLNEKLRQAAGAYDSADSSAAGLVNNLKIGGSVHVSVSGAFGHGDAIFGGSSGGSSGSSGVGSSGGSIGGSVGVSVGGSSGGSGGSAKITLEGHMTKK